MIIRNIIPPMPILIISQLSSWSLPTLNPILTRINFFLLNDMEVLFLLLTHIHYRILFTVLIIRYFWLWHQTRQSVWVKVHLRQPLPAKIGHCCLIIFLYLQEIGKNLSVLCDRGFTLAAVNSLYALLVLFVNNVRELEAFVYVCWRTIVYDIANNSLSEDVWSWILVLITMILIDNIIIGKITWGHRWSLFIIEKIRRKMLTSVILGYLNNSFVAFAALKQLLVLYSTWAQSNFLWLEGTIIYIIILWSIVSMNSLNLYWFHIESEVIRRVLKTTVDSCSLWLNCNRCPWWRLKLIQ